MAMRRWWWRGEIYLSMVEKSIFTCKRLSGLFDLFGVFWRCHAIDLVFDERPKEDQLRQLSSCGCGRLIRNVSGATNSGCCKLKYKYWYKYKCKYKYKDKSRYKYTNAIQRIWNQNCWNAKFGMQSVSPTKMITLWNTNTDIKENMCSCDEWCSRCLLAITLFCWATMTLHRCRKAANREMAFEEIQKEEEEKLLKMDIFLFVFHCWL